MVKYVKYDGTIDLEILFHGLLTFEIDGQRREFAGKCPALGEWDIDLPEDLEPFREEIERRVNERLPGDDIKKGIWGLIRLCIETYAEENEK